MGDVHRLFDELLTRGNDGLDAEAIDRPPQYADEALALRFTARHEHDLRFVNLWGRWLIWDGRRWRTDETLQAFNLSRAIAHSQHKTSRYGRFKPRNEPSRDPQMESV